MPGTLAREESTAPDSPRGTPVPARQARAITALSFAAVVAAALWVGFTATRPVPEKRAPSVMLLSLDRAFPAGGRYPGDPYIGPRACAECHPGEFALYSRSGHALTLGPPRRRALARQLDGQTVVDPEHADVSWDYQYRDGQLHIHRTDRGKVEDCIAEYAFGSGHHAMTFVNVIDPKIPAILEHRITYFAAQHALGMTPGHNTRPRLPHVTPIGGVPPPDQAQKCFNCHATQLSARDDRVIDDQTMIPNVSCERCHGPGRAHVEAARRGATADQLQLPFGPGRYTADSLLGLCGTCHRHPSRSKPGQVRPDDPHLARFQPVGILQSRCFRGSNGTFSCVTCHDPHARASSDRASYLEVCLSCHSGGGRDGDRDRGTMPEPSHPAGAPCPVAPRGDCVDCHMPRVDAGQHVLFADHWIRIHRPGESRLPLYTPSPKMTPLNAPGPRAE
jgi:hypothetical protein